MQDTLAPPARGLGLPPPPGPRPQALGAPTSGWAERGFRLLGRLLALGFIGAVLLNVANVFGRYVLGRSMIGAEEVQTYMMVAMTFFGAAVVAWRGRELRMDVLVHRLPGGARRGLRVGERLVMVLCCGFTAWQSARYAWQMGQLGVHSDGAEIAMWLPHGAVAAGLALVTLVAVVRLVRPPRADDLNDRVLH